MVWFVVCERFDWIFCFVDFVGVLNFIVIGGCFCVDLWKVVFRFCFGGDFFVFW